MRSASVFRNNFCFCFVSFLNHCAGVASIGFKGVCMAPNIIPSLDPVMESESAREISLSRRYVRFGPFHLDRQRQQVYRGGSKLRLQGKVYQVLLVLIQNQGEVVTREQLKQSLWPADTHVNYDANVNTTVNKLRQALGDSSDNPVYVETIPRKGYGLIVPVENADAAIPVAAVAGPNGKVRQKGSAPNVDAPKSDIWITLG